MHARPDRSEAAEYYFTYIDQVTGNDVLAAIARQTTELVSLAQTVSESRSLERYAPDKWSIREVLGHINDTERVFAYRALWFARGFSEPLASFDQDIAMAGSGAHERAWASHLEDFIAVRSATRTLFEALPAESWSRRGTASGKEFSVRAMAYIVAGHVEHHLRLLRERYLNQKS
jgi:DinB superfamily